MTGRWAQSFDDFETTCFYIDAFTLVDWSQGFLSLFLLLLRTIRDRLSRIRRNPDIL